MADIPFGLIWTILILALIVVLVVCGVRLVRGFIRVVVSFTDFLEKSAILDGVEPTRELDRPLVAVLDDLSHIREKYDERMTRRANKKRSRAEARLVRAKMITTVDVTQRKWPHAW
jgi:hypothetical protein